MLWRAHVLWTFAAATLMLDIAARAQPAPHPIGIEDLLADYQPVQSLDVSPDGQVVAYTVGWEKPHIWLARTDEASKPRMIAAGEFPKWSPDGKRLAFYSSSSGDRQLHLYSRQTGSIAQLTRLPGGIDPDPLTELIGMDGWSGDSLKYEWSPDGRMIAFATRVGHSAQDRQGAASERSPIVVVFNHDTPPLDTIKGILPGSGASGSGAKNGTDLGRNQILTVSLDDETVVQVTHGADIFFSPSWAPDGRRLVFVSAEGRKLSGWGSGPTNLYIADLAAGSVKPLTKDKLYKNRPIWSPDGARIAFIGAPAENLGKVYLWTVKPDGRSLSNLTKRLDRRPITAHWYADGQSLLINYYNGVDVPLGRLALDGTVTKLSSADAAIRGPIAIGVAANGDRAWAEDDPTSPGRIYFRKAGRATDRILVDTFGRSGDLQLGQQKIVRWRVAPGIDGEGILVLPVGYKAGKRYPLIVDLYPKQQNGYRGWPMMPGQAWAGRGYAVFYPNVDAPHVWYNPWKALGDTRAKGPAGLQPMMDGVLSGVDELARLQIVDENRVCLYGFSNGGAIVNQLITMTHRFRCAISIGAALSVDWIMPFALQSDAKMIPDIVGATPWEDPEAYDRLSAFRRLPKVNTPLLIVDGDQDDMFLLGSIAMFNGLRYLGKDVEFARYPNQGHVFSGDAMRDLWKRENSFFDRYLQP